MWFWLAIAALLCWSGSDLFSKIGCRDGKDKYSHLKMVMAVGAFAGLLQKQQSGANLRIAAPGDTAVPDKLQRSLADSTGEKLRGKIGGLFVYVQINVVALVVQKTQQSF